VNPVMPMSPKGLYEFGPFRLDSAKHLLQRDGKALQLPPKAFEILILLVAKKGALVPKGDLLHAVWPDTFVEENNLTQYVSMLRKLLGEGVEDQKFIQTVPKLGYRFISDVREIAETDGELFLAKHTRTRIVIKEEEESGEFEGDTQQQPTAARENRAGVRTGSAAGTITVRSTGAKLERPWMWIVGAPVIVLCSLVAFAYSRGLWPRPRAERSPVVLPDAVKPRHSVAVLGFKNLSGRAEDNWLSAALTEMLTTELAAGGQLRMVSGEEVDRIKSDLNLAEPESLAKSTLSQIKNRVGADMTVSGSYVELGKGSAKQVRLDLRVQDTAAGETLFSLAETGSVERLFTLVSRSGTELRAKLGAPTVSSAEEEQVQAAMPSTPEAARLYSQGLSKLRTSNAPDAEKLLARAVSIDPGFALGHSALATAWSALGYDEKAKVEAKRALDLSSNLSRQEHLLIAGQYSEFNRDWDRAVESYQQLFNMFPDSVEYGSRLARAETSSGKGKDALGTLEKLHKLSAPSGQDPQIDLAEAEAAESLGNFKQELEAAERAARNGEALGERLLVARAWVRKAWALQRLGQEKGSIEGLREAKRLFAEAGDVQGVASTFHLIAGAQSEHGDYTEAARSFQEAIEIFRRIGDRRALALSINGLAITCYERGQLRQAKQLYQQYLEIEKEVGSKINTAGALGNLANVAEEQGELSESRRLNEESLKIFEEVGNQRALGTALGNLASVLFEMGDLKGSRKRYQEALEIKRKIGYQRGIAYDLSGLSEVSRAEGDLVAARQNQEESLAIRTQLGEKHNAAASRLYLALLSLEELKPAEAERIALETGEEFRKEKSSSDEAAADVVLANSLLAQAKIAKAQEAISRAKTISGHLTNRRLAFEISIASARISLAGKKPPGAYSVVKASENLETAVAEARKCGYLEYEYKIRLALGEMALESGATREGRARLQTLAADAEAAGFRSLAQNASFLLEAKPSQH
jgi:DNA-binding winged helix-turn-helix (wHTH) protein/tetratricopeptide (TPR) repeat protein/TolB-like protein